MSHTHLSPALLLALAATAFAAAPAHAGPPWVSIEYPANPFDPATRGALLVVHTYHHRLAMSFPVRAVAEGVVGGQRRRIELPVSRTPGTGIWAVGGELPRDGSWVVVATMTSGETGAQAAALVGIGAGGRLASISVPHEMRDGWIVPRTPTRAEIDDALRGAVALGAGDPARRAAADALGAATLPVTAGLALLVLVPGFLARRVRQRGLERRASGR